MRGRGHKKEPPCKVDGASCLGRLGHGGAVKYLVLEATVRRTDGQVDQAGHAERPRPSTLFLPFVRHMRCDSPFLLLDLLPTVAQAQVVQIRGPPFSPPPKHPRRPLGARRQGQCWDEWEPIVIGRENSGRREKEEGDGGKKNKEKKRGGGGRARARCRHRREGKRASKTDNY